MNAKSLSGSTHPLALLFCHYLIIGVCMLQLSGCVSTHVQDDRFELSNSVASYVSLGTSGLFMVFIGTLLLFGRIKPGSGKPRVLGAMLAFLGSLVVIAAATYVPYTRVSITPDEFRYENGFLGQQ